MAKKMTARGAEYGANVPAASRKMMLKPPRAARPVLSMFGFTPPVTLAAGSAASNFSFVDPDDLQVFSDDLDEQGLLHFA